MVFKNKFSFLMTVEINAMVEWIRSNGGFIDEGLYVDCNTPGNRTIRSRCAFSPNEDLVRIPDCCCIKGEFTDVCLKLIIEIAKGSASEYAPYLRVLPTEEQLSTELPIYMYKRVDLPILTEISPAFANAMRAYFNEIEDFYTRHLITCVQIPDEYKRYKYAMYAVAIYHSRAWNSQGLIPYIDLIQHENNMQLNGNVQIADGIAKFKSFRYVNPGDQLTWHYSLNNNLMLYANYGIPLHNSAVYIPATLNWSDYKGDGPVAEYIRKCLIAGGLNPNVSGEFRIVYTEKGLNVNALNIARILNCVAEDIRDELQPLDSDTPISLHNEQAALNVLIKQLRSITNASTSASTNDEEKYAQIVKIVKRNVEVVESLIKELEARWMKLLNE